MNKTEMIEAIASKLDMPKSQVVKVVNEELAMIKETLTKKESVRLVGFGTFETRHRNEHMSRNPKTGEPVKVSAHDVVAFKAGKDLKESVR